MTAWLSAFLFTIAFEMPIFAWGMRRAFPDGRVQVAIAVGASLITHPILWIATRSAEIDGAHLLLYEAIVAIVEAIYLLSIWKWRGAGKPSASRCLLVALLANALSFGLGLLPFTC